MVLNALSLLLLTVAMTLKSGNCSPTPNISISVLIKLRMFVTICCATLADTVHLNTKLFHPEAGRDRAAQLHGSERIEGQVGDGAAARADQVVMGFAVGVDPP